MIRSELVQCLVEDDLGQEAAHAIVATFFNEIANRLAAGGRVELRGFGVFTTRVRDPRVGRDPRTGESVEVTRKRVPFFKLGQPMLERLKRRVLTHGHTNLSTPTRGRHL